MSKKNKLLLLTKSFCVNCMSLCVILLMTLFPEKDFGFLKLKNKDEFLKQMVLFRKALNDLLDFFGISKEICEIDSGIYVDYSLYCDNKATGYYVSLFYRNLRELNDVVIKLSLDTFPNLKNRWPSNLLDRIVQLACVNNDLIQAVLESYGLTLLDLDQYEYNMNQALNFKKFLS